MTKFIIVKKNAIQISGNYEDAIEQIINAFILNNLGSLNLRSILNLIGSTLDITSRNKNDFKLLFTQALDLGLETVGQFQAIQINREDARYSLPETRLQTLLDLLFESEYFVRIGPDHDFYYTDKFYQWFDQEIVNIVVGGKSSDDDLLMQLAKTFKLQNHDHISQAYASILSQCVFRSKNIEEAASAVVYH